MQTKSLETLWVDLQILRKRGGRKMKAAACLLLWHKRVTVSEAVGRNQYLLRSWEEPRETFLGFLGRSRETRILGKRKKEVGGTKLSSSSLFRILALETNTLSISEALEKLSIFFSFDVYYCPLVHCPYTFLYGWNYSHQKLFETNSLVWNFAGA